MTNCFELWPIVRVQQALHNLIDTGNLILFNYIFGGVQYFFKYKAGSKF